jgi:uncharacterized membrane protein
MAVSSAMRVGVVIAHALAVIGPAQVGFVSAGAAGLLLEKREQLVLAILQIEHLGECIGHIGIVRLAGLRDLQRGGGRR